MNDQAMMAMIRDHFGAYIRAAVSGSGFPESFFAALTANETSGVPTQTRFESAVLGHLVDMVILTEPNFGAITREGLLGVCWPANKVNTLTDGLVSLKNLATSWGPTQIMGYQSLAAKYPLVELSNLDTHYKHAVEILADFQKRFDLPVMDEAPGAPKVTPTDYFACWNSGSPEHEGAPGVALYVMEGLHRMTLYEALP